MNYVVLGCCLALLAYGVGVLAGTPLALALLPVALRSEIPDRRARRLFALRLLPPVLGGFLAFGVVLPAFVWLEPISTGESLRNSILVGAGLAAALLLLGAIRLGLDLHATSRLVRRFRNSARSIDLPGISLPSYEVEESFPLVAVVGCLCPSLFVSSRVLECCTSDEMTAIVAHECGHLLRGDAWKRPLLRACPDLLAIAPFARGIERRWAAAAEQAADDHASCDGPSRALDLASALIKVARLAGAAGPRDLPANALYRGEGIRRRVARLLSPDRKPSGVRRWRYRWALTGVAVLSVPAFAYLGVFARVHELIEAVVLGF